MSRRLPVLLAAVVLASGCALPLPRGVHVSRSIGTVPGSPGELQVLPPGPRKGATPVEVVEGFIGAQSSTEGNHQIARQYLTDRASWADDEAVIYNPASLRLAESVTGPTEVEVTASFTGLGRLGRDGLYSATMPTPVSESYQVVRALAGQWRIAGPPPGLRLTPADRDRSFPARQVYFLSRSPHQHLVVDRVLLPVGGQPGEAAIRRLLLGPSAALGAAVTTAFPAGTHLESLRSDSSGTDHVALSAAVLRADDLGRQLLSAQLSWTLQDADAGYRRLVLTVNGQPFKVPGEEDVQDRGDWSAYQPDQVAGGPVYYVAPDGRVRTTAGASADPGPPGSAALHVAALAVTPDRSRVALLQVDKGRATIRIGPGGGYPVVAAGAGLSSMSWGSAELGLFLLDGAGRVLLLNPGHGAQAVPGFTGQATALAVSRDGVRVALVAGGRLLLGRLEPTAGPVRVRIAGLTQVVPDLTGVTRVAWHDNESLVALGSLSQTFVPVLLTVDGASVRSLPVSGLPAQPQEVASAPFGTAVVAAGHLYLLDPLGFRAGPVGHSPAFPG